MGSRYLYSGGMPRWGEVSPRVFSRLLERWTTCNGLYPRPFDCSASACTLTGQISRWNLLYQFALAHWQIPLANFDATMSRFNDGDPKKSAVELIHRESADSRTIDNASAINSGSVSGTGSHDGEKVMPGSAKHNKVTAMLKNPLAGMDEAAVQADVDAFIAQHGLEEYTSEFRKGACLARVQNVPNGFESVHQITEEERTVMRDEISHRWRQPKMLYFLVVLCAGSAIVQGMDQTVTNGAQQFYFDEFEIGEDQVYIRGLLNGAPYACSALIGCWLNAPLNRFFGRRGCIFISCFISFAASFWMAAADSWYNLLIARFALGLAVGAKSSTTPVYAAESVSLEVDVLLRERLMAGAEIDPWRFDDAMANVDRVRYRESPRAVIGPSSTLR